jgi:hypothetical protein
MKIVKLLSRISAFAILACGFAAGADGISLNFVGGGFFSGTPSPLAPTDLAGVIKLANWNNTPGNQKGGFLGLVDSAGVPTTASVLWSSDNTWSSPIPETNPDYRLMKGYLDNGLGGSVRITVTGIPYPKYHIYVYANDDNNSGGTIGRYELDHDLTLEILYGQTDPVFDGTYKEAFGAAAGDPNAKGNYLVFRDVTEPTFDLTAYVVSLRAPINGIQIINASTNTQITYESTSNDLVVGLAGNDIFPATANALQSLLDSWYKSANIGEAAPDFEVFAAGSLQTREASNAKSAKHILVAFKNLVNAQAGKHISPQLATILLLDADALIAQTP